MTTQNQSEPTPTTSAVRLRIWVGRVSIISLAPIATFGSRFAGNIIMSHMLAPEEFGTAIAISVVLSLGGLATDVALDRFVMINDSMRALSTAHMLSIIIGVLLAIVLVVSSPLAAELFGVGNFSGSFAVAGGITALGGFFHLGVKQIQRNYIYGPAALVNVAAQLAALAALFLAAIILRNHRVIIVSSAVGLVTTLVLSHLLARTPYRVRYDRPMLLKALSFGLPLTLNGVALAIMYQLDRVLVGYWFGVKDLALYAIIFSLSVVPTNMLLTIFAGPSLSYLLAGSHSASDRSERYHLILGFYSLLASLYTLWVVLFLDILTPLIFGPSFTVSPLAHVLFALIACLRFQRGGAPTIFLVANARTTQLALLNLSAGLGLLIAFGCIVVSPRLESMLVGIVIGELISYTLFFTSLGQVVARGSAVFVDLSTAIAVPAAMAATLILEPEIAWQSREIIFISGVVALSAQLVFEFRRNAKVRELFFGESFKGVQQKEGEGA